MSRLCTHRRSLVFVASSLLIAASGLVSGCGTLNGLPGPFAPGTYIVAFSPNAIDGYTYLGPTQNAPVEAWDEKALMKTGMTSPAGCALNDLIYSAGGNYNGADTGILQVYHPLTNVWQTLTSMPNNRTAAVAGAVNGRMYVIGGLRKVNNVFQVVSFNEAYDPGTDTWASRADLPAPRAYAAVAVVNNRIYVIGGEAIVNNVFADQNSVYEYDPAGDTWTTKTSMQTARSTIAAAVANGLIYVIGGSGLGSTLVEVYDPVNNSWTTGKPMTYARGAPAAFGWNGYIYAVGGKTTGGGFEPTVERYNPVLDVWNTFSNMPRLRALFGFANIGPKCFCFGGLARYNNLDHANDFTCDQYFAASEEYLFRKN